MVTPSLVEDLIKYSFPSLLIPHLQVHRFIDQLYGYRDNRESTEGIGFKFATVNKATY